MQTKPFFQTALSLSLALALSACAVHSADQNLTLESTGQVMSAAETAERYDVNGNWWEIYQSPQLNALMAQALENNIDLKQAAISVNKALYQANILGADLVPSFSGSLSASTSKNLKTGSHGRPDLLPGSCMPTPMRAVILQYREIHLIINKMKH